jgi:hypothetical protein
VFTNPGGVDERTQPSEYVSPFSEFCVIISGNLFDRIGLQQVPETNYLKPRMLNHFHNEQ